MSSEPAGRPSRLPEGAGKAFPCRGRFPPLRGREEGAALASGGTRGGHGCGLGSRGISTRGRGCWGSWRWICPERGRGEGRKRRRALVPETEVRSSGSRAEHPGSLAEWEQAGTEGGRGSIPAPRLKELMGCCREGAEGQLQGPRVTQIIPTCPEGTYLGRRRRNRVLQRGKRAEGPGGSLSHRTGQGWGTGASPVQATAPSEHRISALAGVSSHSRCRLCSSQPQAPEPSAIPGHTGPTRVPHGSHTGPTRVPHGSPCRLGGSSPCQAQHRAGGSQTHPLLAKPSGAPSPSQPWDPALMPGILVGWMGHTDVSIAGGDGSEDRAVMQWR